MGFCIGILITGRHSWAVTQGTDFDKGTPGRVLNLFSYDFLGLFLFFLAKRWGLAQGFPLREEIYRGGYIRYSLK